MTKPSSLANSRLMTIVLAVKFMEIVHTISALRTELASARRAEKRIVFVPTMGNLHPGHLSLLDEAQRHGAYIVASIFVNPMQFGANEDLDAYPRTLKEDAEGLQQHGCNLLFAPSANEIYPDGLSEETRIEVPGVSRLHCGASRPGHFIGVATVVAKLFNLVQPDCAVFGNKDYQQLAVIRKLTQDLMFPIDIIGVATSREDSGLARSSRNGYLSDIEREQAAAVYQSLLRCQAALHKQTINLNDIITNEKQWLIEQGFKIDYLNIANPYSLAPAQDTDREFVVLLAVVLGSTRLIDNIRVSR